MKSSFAACLSLFATVAFTATAAEPDYGPKPNRFYSINITHFATKETLWVALPDFTAGAASSEGAGATLEQVVDGIEKAADALRESDRAVIFDLRGNEGSDESFGRRLATAFWGTETAPKTFPPLVAVVTDGRCGAACIAFAELVRAKPNTKHLGVTYRTRDGKRRQPHATYAGPWDESEVQHFAAAKAGSIPDGAAAWRQAYLDDLDFLHGTIADNHPAAIDDLNPQSKAWVNDGYAQAKARADAVVDYGGYLYGLRAYINGFKDPHTSFAYDFPAGGALWPGFVAAMRSGKPTVIDRDESDTATPLVGAEIVACDGEALEQLAARIVYPFLLNERLHADRLRGITRLFLKPKNPFVQHVASCMFKTTERSWSQALRWRTQNAAFSKAFGTANFGYPTKWGVSEPRDGVVWIGLETFDTSEEPAKELEKIIAQIEANAAAWRSNKKVIVFDVRGNGGGSSAWGDRIRDAIWGKQPEQEDHTAVEWRASKDNLAFLEEAWIRIQKNTTVTPELRKDIEETLAAIRSAVASGKPFAKVGAATPGPEGGLTKRRPKGKSKFKAQVVFLNDGACGSACGDFADRVLQQPGVIHAGFWTSGDGVYMDGRGVPTPSGLGFLSFAMKVYRGRERGHLEEYEPDWLYEGSWDDAALQAWLFEKLGLK